MEPVEKNSSSLSPGAEVLSAAHFLTRVEAVLGENAALEIGRRAEAAGGSCSIDQLQELVDAYVDSAHASGLEEHRQAARFEFSGGRRRLRPVPVPPIKETFVASLNRSLDVE